MKPFLQITESGNIVTPDSENYFSINIGRGEVAHLVNGKIIDYIHFLKSSELQEFLKCKNMTDIRILYKKFIKITY